MALGMLGYSDIFNIDRDGCHMSPFFAETCSDYELTMQETEVF